MKIASIQMTAIEGDKAATIEKARDLILQCKGADLVILPEIWNIGFMSFDRYVDEAEAQNGPTMQMLIHSAKEIKACLHTGSFVEVESGHHFNSSYLLSPDGSVLAQYRKIHLFGYDSLETQILTPGDRVTVVNTPLGTIGMATCYDLRFPELFRAMLDKGAEIFLICSAWPYPRLPAWQTLNRVRALENQCFLISANAVGMNAGVRLVGHSMVVDPWGTVMAGGGDLETIIKSELDLNLIKSAREEFPVLKNRVAWLNGKT